MHVVVSWEIGATAERWEAINEELKKRLSAFPWARPLATLYVVRVSGDDGRQYILSQPRDVQGPVRGASPSGPLATCERDGRVNERAPSGNRTLTEKGHANAR